MIYKLKKHIRGLIRGFGYELIPVKAVLHKDVKKDYDEILELIGKYSFKFLDVKAFLPITIDRAFKINLHRSSRLDILDIGTGVGYFPVVCKYYGHKAVAIDRDGNKVFEDTSRWLGIDRRSWEIKSFEKIPYLGQKFDLITAFMVNFDRYKDSGFKPWGISEWQFFLTDLVLNHLKENSQIVMRLNPHTKKTTKVIRFFKESGAEIKNSWVIFRTTSRLRQENRKLI